MKCLWFKTLIVGQERKDPQEDGHGGWRWFCFLLDAVMAALAMKEEAGKRGRHGEGDIMQHVFSLFYFFVKVWHRLNASVMPIKPVLKLIELTEADKDGESGKRGEKGVRTGKRKTHYKPVFFF